MLAKQLNYTIKNGVLYGDENFFVPKHLNCGAIALEKILEYKDKVALINGETGEQITYREMAQNIVNIASALTALGLKRGDVVAILSENRIEYMVTSLAVFCCGGIITFLNNAYTKDDIIHAINISKPVYIFMSGEMYQQHYETFKKHGDIRRFVVYDDIPRSNDCLRYKYLSERYINIESYKPENFEGTVQTCMILYSSGTTGPSKGAKLNHRNFIVSYQQPRPIENKNFIPLSIAPWSSTMGQMCTLREIVFGRTVVFLAKYNERLYIQTIDKYKISILQVAPPLIVMLCKSNIVNEYNLSSVKFIHSGGAPINFDVIRQLRKRFPHIKHVLQGYGMTETTGALCEDLEISPREGSVGRIIPGNIIKIVDPETNKVLGVGEPGEVLVKGLSLFDGFIRKDMKNDFDHDGFYKTGDIAYYDKDGYFYIVDRIKELIKYKAWQVAPSEIEALLIQHPAVKDAGVTGTPDLLAGELPSACIVKQPGAKITEQELIDYVSDKVTHWKRLRGGVLFVNEIPKTPSGKILRRKLLALLTEQSPQKLPASKL